MVFIPAWAVIFILGLLALLVFGLFFLRKQLNLLEAAADKLEEHQSVRRTVGRA